MRCVGTYSRTLLMLMLISGQSLFLENGRVGTAGVRFAELQHGTACIGMHRSSVGPAARKGNTTPLFPLCSDGLGPPSARARRRWTLSGHSPRRGFQPIGRWGGGSTIQRATSELDLILRLLDLHTHHNSIFVWHRSSSLQPRASQPAPRHRMYNISVGASRGMQEMGGR